MNFDPNMLPEYIRCIAWGLFAMFATDLLVRVILLLMREIERLP